MSESLVYRFVTPVGDYEGLARRSAQMSEMAPRAANQPNGDGAIDHVDSYLRRTRPDLGYTPANPRLEVADWQAIQRIRIYVQQGKMGEVADVFREAGELYRQHDIAEPYSITVQGIGPDSPIVEVQVFGSSVADIYEAGERINGLIGAELDELRGRIGVLSRRVEFDNFVIRRDLNYQPAN